MTCKVMKSASSMKVIDWLKRYPRMERVRLTEGITKQLNPGISNRAMIRAVNIQSVFPQRLFKKINKTAHQCNDRCNDRCNGDLWKCCQ